MLLDDEGSAGVLSFEDQVLPSAAFRRLSKGKQACWDRQGWLTARRTIRCWMETFSPRCLNTVRLQRDEVSSASAVLSLNIKWRSVRWSRKAARIVQETETPQS